MLEKAGISVGILGEKEICCGSPAIRIGDRETFFDLVKRNMETVQTGGREKDHHPLRRLPPYPEV